MSTISTADLTTSLDRLSHVNSAPLGETDAYVVRARLFNPVVDQVNTDTEVLNYLYYWVGVPDEVTAVTAGTALDADRLYHNIASAVADYIVTLPAPASWAVGREITLVNSGATGYELRTSGPTTISLNGGTGTNAESAIAAGTVVKATLVSSTAWVAYSISATGLVEAVEAAA